MSNWDEQPDENPTPGGGHSTTTPNDGFADERDDGSMAFQGEDAVDVEPNKRSGPNPKVILAILCVFTVGVVGFLGNRMYQRFKPAPAAQSVVSEAAPAQAQAEVAANAPVEAAPVQPVATPYPTQTAVTQPEPSAAPATVVAANTAAMPVSAAAADVQAAQAPAIASTPQQVQLNQEVVAKVDAQERRMMAVEASVEQLNKTVQALSAKPAKSADSDRAGQAAKVVSKPRRASRPSPGTHPANDGATPGASVLAGWSLRGVYPPQGENRQAWVLDASTGNIAVVSAGSMLADYKVLRVEPDRVVTSRGTIQ